MLLIKLTAAQLRVIKGARTPAEYEGVVTCVRDAIDVAENMAKMGKTPTLRADQGQGRQSRQDRQDRPEYPTWQRARDIAHEVLGRENVRMPPFPERNWYMRLSTAIKRQNMDEDYVRRLAQHAKDRLRMPISLEFMMSQGERILGGDFDHQTQARKQDGVSLITTHQLPDE